MRMRLCWRAAASRAEDGADLSTRNGHFCAGALVHEVFDRDVLGLAKSNADEGPEELALGEDAQLDVIVIVLVLDDRAAWPIIFQDVVVVTPNA